MDPFDPDAVIHVLSRCEACQLGQVGTRVCVEKGHMATVASVKRSAQGNNFVDPYTEEEVDARYRLMLKPGEPLTILQTNAVIDGAVKFAPGTVFQQPPNTKSQTLLGCFKQAIPLQDFVLGGSAANKKEKDIIEEGESELGAKRKVLSPPGSTSSRRMSSAPSMTSNQSPKTTSDRAAMSGLSGIPSQFSRELDGIEGWDEDGGTEGSHRPAKRPGTRSSSGNSDGQLAGAAASAPDSATQLEMLARAEAELRRSFEAHMKYLDQAEKGRKEEMAAFQRAGELALQNIEKSRKATKDDGLKQHKAFSLQRQRITRLRMQEVDQERARNQLDSERREAKLKAEKEALSRACQAEAEELGNAWAMVEAAAGFSSPGVGVVEGDDGVKIEKEVSTGVKEEERGEGDGGKDGANGDSVGQ